MANNVDFFIEQGSTFVLDFQVFDDQLAPIPLLSESTNDLGSKEYSLDKYTMRMKMRKSKYRSPVLYSCGTTQTFALQNGVTHSFTQNGIYFVGGSTGYARMVITDATTATFKPGLYFYDIEMVESLNPGTVVSRIGEGRIEIEAESTKS